MPNAFIYRDGDGSTRNKHVFVDLPFLLTHTWRAITDDVIGISTHA